MDNRTQATREFCRQIDRGLISAVPVPFDEAGRIDEAAQAQYIAWMATQPVAGVAVWVHTGRGLALTREQRRDVLRAWVAGLPKDKVIVAGAGAPLALAGDPEAYRSAALQMAEDAAAGGGHALLIHPPRVSDVAAYHARLAGAGLPMILFYLYEAAGGVSYSNELLDELLAMPSVAGIKMATLDSVMRYQEVSRRLEQHSDRLLITGEDRFFGYSFMRGARAALVGIGAACCSLLVLMMRAWFDGDAPRFIELSRMVDELAEVTFVPPMEGYIQRMMLVLAAQGVLPESSALDPWGPKLDRGAESARIKDVLKRLRLPPNVLA